MLIQNAAVFLPDGRFTLCDVRFSDRILELGRFPDEEGIDATGRLLVPGLIDLHTHGALGCDFSDGTPDTLPTTAKYYAAHGVTHFLATAMTLPEDALVRAAKRVAEFVPGADMARCAGLFLEGPFLSYAKRGAQAAEYLHTPDYGLFCRVHEASGHRVRMVSVAPETPGAIPFIESVSPICSVAVGHTACGYDEAAAAFSAGATQLTHLFNAMNPLLHRAPGPIGAGMDAGAYAELIVDGLHVHPSAVRAAFSLFPERVVLVSDSLRCAGMPDGEYTLAGQGITLQRGCCTLSGTDTLAGSVITVHDAIKNAVRFGIAPEKAIAAATHNPARAARMEDECGFLRPGLAADLLLLDADLSLDSVFLGGKRLSPAPA